MSDRHSSAPTMTPVQALDVDRRSAFIVRTYNTLFVSILAFVGVEVLLFTSGLAERLALFMFKLPWLVILGAFIGASWLASRTAQRATERSTQYLALSGFVLAEALIFVPLLYMANHYAPGAISSAALVTFVAFAGLTGIAFWTRKDFSFLGGLLRWAVVLAIVAIVAGAIFGFNLGMWFSVAMVGVAGAAILYDTGNIIHHFPEDRHVAAALQLFASVALMFWYVLSIFLSRR